MTFGKLSAQPARRIIPSTRAPATPATPAAPAASPKQSLWLFWTLVFGLPVALVTWTHLTAVTPMRYEIAHAVKGAYSYTSTNIRMPDSNELAYSQESIPERGDFYETEAVLGTREQDAGTCFVMLDDKKGDRYVLSETQTWAEVKEPCSTLVKAIPVVR